ncbi:MAG: hypothetical protein JXB48_11010 [Candidatus Latescibacteria bacterium]|nr:hypothetical protein [Candidatus Latescibacterota bacterium]
MRQITLILLFVFSLHSQNINEFPLWGSSWIVAQGNNKKIFPSVLPLMPDKIAIVQFKSDKSLFIAYANCNHRTYRCSAELVEEIDIQFEKNRVLVPFDSILTGNTVNIAYKPFNDTVWTGDRDLVNFSSKYRSIGRLTGKTDSVFSSNQFNNLRNSPVFFRSKPVYYGIRLCSVADIDNYSIESINDDGSNIFLENKDYFKENDPDQKQAISGLGSANLQSLNQSVSFVNYRKDNQVYEYIPCEYEFKTANIGYWQVHLHPQVWYYPRDPFDGHGLCFDELKMTPEEAQEKRSASLNDPENLDLKYYRNPFLSDSASVIISFGFCNIPSTDMTEMNSIYLVDTTVQINHYPPYMYRIPAGSLPTNPVNYQAPLYQLYSKDPAEEKFYSELESNCPSWRVYDMKNADLIFPPKLQETGRLVRDHNVDDGIFNYHGCPCSRIPSLLNLTPVQLRRMVFLTPPMCDRGEMIKAYNLYNQFLPYLKNKTDHNLIMQKKTALLKVIQERDSRAAKAGVDWSAPNERCPDTWVDAF